MFKTYLPQLALARAGSDIEKAANALNETSATLVAKHYGAIFGHVIFETKKKINLKFL